MLAKHVCLYLCNTCLNHSTRELAGVLDLASHNSVAVAIRRTRDRVRRNPSLRAVVERLQADILRPDG